MQKKLFFICVLVMGVVNAMADVVNADEVVKKFVILNTDEYKGYHFFYVTGRYTYDRGYQRTGDDTIAYMDKIAAATHRHEGAKLIAQDASGNWYKSDVELSGPGRIVGDERTISETFIIQSISNGKIELKQMHAGEKSPGTNQLAIATGNDTTSEGHDDRTVAWITLAAVVLSLVGAFAIVFGNAKAKQ